MSGAAASITPRLSGAAVRRLMRRHRKTIRGAATQYGLTMARVRHVRAHGVEGEAYVRDWLEICGVLTCTCAGSSCGAVSGVLNPPAK